MLFITPMVLRAQVINGGFEEWDNGSPSYPVGWIARVVHPIKWGATHSGTWCARARYTFEDKFGVDIDILRNDVYPRNGFGVPSNVKGFSFWYILKDTANMTALVSYTVSRDKTPEFIVPYFVLPLSKEWHQFHLQFPASYQPDVSLRDTILIIYGFRFGKDTVKDNNIDFLIDDVEYDTTSLGVSASNKSAGATFSLLSNPISSHTNLRYNLPSASAIRAALYDVTGREVLQLPLVDDASLSGSIPFDADELPNGMYYLRCDVGGNVTMLKVIVRH